MNRERLHELAEAAARVQEQTPYRSAAIRGNLGDALTISLEQQQPGCKVFWCGAEHQEIA